MTTRILTGTYSAGYALQPPTTLLSIAAGGYVGGFGVASPEAATVSYKIINDGMIEAAAYLVADGVNLTHGGGVINGRENHAAVIFGFNGVEIGGRSAKITNFGTIEGVYGDGVVLQAGGTVTNGAAGDTTARIQSYDAAVYIQNKAGGVVNFGTITDSATYGFRAAAVMLSVGGDVRNGSNADTTARISGYRGVEIAAHATVTNFGTIASTAGHQAVVIYGNGVLTNGSNSDFRALLSGGVSTNGALTLANFGRMVGYARYNGLSAGPGAVITNGSATATHALIEGANGVDINDGPATLTNFGTIWGRNGYAVRFDRNPHASLDVLVVEAGSAFVGRCFGGGAASLELAGGAGRITARSGTFSNTGQIYISGSMPTATFGYFASVEVGGSGAFTAQAVAAVAAGATLKAAGSLTLVSVGGGLTNAGLIETIGAGVLTVDGALANTGTILAGGGVLTVTGSVAGAGAVTIGHGRLDLATAGATNVTFSSQNGVLELGQSQGFSGAVTGFSRRGDTSLDLDDIGFVSAGEATFSGTATSGVLTVTDGVHTAHITLVGDFRHAAFVASDDGHGGVLVVDPTEPRAAPAQRFVAAAAGLGAAIGGGVHAPPAVAVHERSLAIPRAAIS